MTAEFSRKIFQMFVLQWFVPEGEAFQ